MSAARRSGGHGENMVGNYKRLESIGKGSFATVYKAIQPSDGSFVAIKTVQHAQLKGKLKANLFSEIDILKRIHHPHIVALLNILESANHIHLVMEFCQLGDLATFVRKRNTLISHPITQDMISNYPSPPGSGFNEVIVRHFAKQLGSAMAFLRSKNLVHRDLKPQNLLLNPPAPQAAIEVSGNPSVSKSSGKNIVVAGVASMPILKIADFGFARHLPQTTMAETLCGSPLYMAPEILRYEKYDNKADLWSLGTVLYELSVGRPPFRAANHVELLRKIERGLDKIDFPANAVISKDMQQLICGLLRRMPTERMSWDAFFSSPVLKGDIPGLVEADKPQLSNPTLEQQVSISDATPISTKSERKEDLVCHASNEATRGDQDRHTSTASSAKATVVSKSQNSQDTREQSISPLTERIEESPRRANGEAPTSERRRPQSNQLSEAGAPSTSPQRRRVHTLKQEKPPIDERDDRRAQDLLLERDYVMIEKRSVEINAFADEMAASPRLLGVARDHPISQMRAIVRRATTQGIPTPPQSSTNYPIQPAAGSRRDNTDRPQILGKRDALDKKVSSNSAIAAALEKVQFRMPFLFPYGRGISPPQNYGPWPAFPAIPPAGPPISTGETIRSPEQQEDQGIVIRIEEHATRSDVVFAFAEVKYKQLVPSVLHRGPNIGAYRDMGPNENEPADDSIELTFDAIIAISEEALVLYIKALAILTNTIHLAGAWWNRRGRGQIKQASQNFPASQNTVSNDGAVELRVNQVVQWARSRFNECLEKSEYASQRLLEAQRRLNAVQPPQSSGASDRSGQTFDATNIHLTSGITAAKLMYDRAVDISRGAAVNELVGEDLQGCEVGYTTAIRLLEAVLEDDEEASLNRKQRTSPAAETDEHEISGNTDGIEEGDRKVVLKLIEGVRARLSTLRSKIDLHISAAKQRHKRSLSSASNTPSQSSGLNILGS